MQKGPYYATVAVFKKTKTKFKKKSYNKNSVTQ